jgi:hypothetical protein
MRSQLLIRPGPNDHRVIEDLLAPGGSGIFRGVRPVVDQLVVDATAVVYRPGLAAVAARAGIPFLVDPMTPFCQVALADDDRWAALPYGSAPAMSIGDLATASARDDLVTRVLSFEVDHGASVVIPPYFYSRSPGDPWFDVSLDLLERTARHMARSDVRLPLLPILCAQLHQFGSPDTWAAGIDRFVRIAGAAAAARVGLFLSPMGEADDTYGNVERLFASALRVRGTGISVIAWGQGVYGPALVAAGLDGYETGIGMRERTDVAAALNRRRPRVVEPPRSRRTPQTIFLQPLGRSLLLSVAEHLLDDLSMRAKLVCDDEFCCADGVQSMRRSRRQHTVRARARYLAELDEMPMHDWRLYRITRDARETVTLTLQANQVLAAAGHPQPLAHQAAEALAQVADRLLEERLSLGA